MPTDDDLQRAFRLISCLHPDRAVALCVLLDAYDRISIVQKLQGRRPDSIRPSKLKIPEESLFQFSVYWASETWEKDQESKTPKKQPRYKPTYDDLLVRYIKTIIWKSMNRRSCYAAVGLGCLLYTYQPHEVSSLAEDFFDSDNIRRVKSWLIAQVKMRFQGVGSFSNGNEHVVSEVPTKQQRALVTRSLSRLAPWCSCYPATQALSNSLLETYFDKESQKSEWERVHVLIDPTCGGLSRLIHEYNATYRKGNDMRLDEPGDKLKIPKFDDELYDPETDDGGHSDPGGRFDPSPLDRNEISSIKHSFERNQNRRRNYRSGDLRIYVDGEEVATLVANSTFEPITILSDASCVEVVGEDSEGDLLLAVFPLMHSEADEQLELCIKHEGGQKIEMTASPIFGQGDEDSKRLIYIEYSGPQSDRVSSPPLYTETYMQPPRRYEDRTYDTNIFIDDDVPITGARIKVIGIGGAGGNAVNRMIEAGIEGVEFLVANTDLQALKRSRAPIKIQLGSRLTKGLGAGADPMVGREAALEDTEKIIEVLEGADMVFVTTGLGGGTGTGGAPIIASLATELNALTVAVVTKPFHFEGRRRMMQAEQGLRELRESVDTVITIPNERLLHLVAHNVSLADSFRVADDVLRQAVQGISDLITVPGLINLDFADIQAIMAGMGIGLIGSGRASGEHRAMEATQQAISSPLLEEATIEGAKGVLINITGGPDLTLYEVNEASSIIREAADDDANIIFGAVIDEMMRDEMKITVIATGFDKVMVDRSTTAHSSQRTKQPPRYTRADVEALRPPTIIHGRPADMDEPILIRKKAD